MLMRQINLSLQRAVNVYKAGQVYEGFRARATRKRGSLSLRCLLLSFIYNQSVRSWGYRACIVATAWNAVFFIAPPRARLRELTSFEVLIRRRLREREMTDARYRVL